MQKEIYQILEKRYSCKDFDENKKVSKEDLHEFIEIFRLSPSMLNIQPWKIFIIEDKNLKEKLQNFAGNQKQVGTNSHLIVFARKNNFDKNFFEKVAKNSKNREKCLENLENFFKNFQTKEEEITWAISQVSVALGNIISFLTLKNIQTCAIGVFNREKFDEILGLNEKGYSSVFNLCIGYAKNEKILFLKDRLETEEITEFL